MRLLRKTKKTPKPDYFIWKGVRVPRFMARFDQGWHDLYVKVVAKILCYRAIDSLEPSEAIDKRKLSLVYEIGYSTGKFMAIPITSRGNFSFIDGTIGEADRLQKELNENA